MPAEHDIAHGRPGFGSAVDSLQGNAKKKDELDQSPFKKICLRRLIETGAALRIQRMSAASGQSEGPDT
jgi:hypothetical protein